MSTAMDLHARAMEQVDAHEVALRRNNLEAARTALRLACELEVEAARKVPKAKEPMRSVLFRSAASLAYLCARPRLASELIRDGLKGKPHPEIAEELRELRESPPGPDESFAGAVTDEVANYGDLVQRLIIRAGNRPIVSELSGGIQAAWSRLFERVVRDLVPGNGQMMLESLAAGPGSYCADLRVRLTKRKGAEAVGAAREALEAILGLLDAAEAPDPDLAQIVSLLQQHRAELAVEMTVVGRGRAGHIAFPEATEDLAKRLRTRAAGG